jgi:prevent-host-death family protein
MEQVTVRELRNHGGEVIDRVVAGERLTITRDGRRVAELRPLARPTLPAALIVERWSRLPEVDPRRFRQDVDEILDAGL